MSDNLKASLSVGVVYSGDGSGLTAEQEEQLNKIPMIEQSVEEITNDLNTKANTSDIPTNTSELNNDSGFLTSIPSEYVTETEMNEAIANVSSGGSVDLSGYATKDELNTKANISDIPTNTSDLNNDSGFLTSIPSEYVTETEMNEAIANISSGGSVDLSGYATKDELNSKANTSDIPTNTSDLNNDSGFLTSIPSEYVTETEMNEAISNISSGGSVDLSGYATKDDLNTKANTSDIPTNTSELNNDSGFLTSIPSEYVTETEMNEAIANVSSGGSVSQEDINTAVNNYLTEHPVSGGATTEQVAQIQANKTAVQTLETLVGDKSGLPSGDANVIASINRIDSKSLEPINYTLGSNVSKTIQRINSDMPNCIVSFISDDLYMADYTKKDWFKELGCAYTIPVVCSRINSDGYPTLEQVLELQNDYGYEIASHTFNHVQLDKQTDEVMEEELKSSFEFLNKNGLRCENFMIPYGAYNNKVLAVASKYYRSIRSSEEDYNSIGLDTTRIKSFWIDRYKTTDLEGQKTRVDNAFENGLWLIFSMHTGTMGESEFTDMVKPLIEYVNSKNIPIMTVSKALDYFQNPIEVSSITSAGVRTRHFYINAKGEIISDKITLLSNKILEQENTIKVLTSKQNDIISRLTALEQNTGGAVYVQSVSINNTPITVQINKSKKLTCTVLPSTATDKTVVWSGDNDSIATITSDGTITGNQLGTVNITVTTNDGNKTDTVSVEVVENHISSEDFRTLTLDGSENWSEDTSFKNHGSTYDTSVFKTPTPSWCDGTKNSYSKFSRDFKEVNFPVVPGLSTMDMYNTYHDNAIVVRDDSIYVEIKNSLLSTTGVNGFKNYLNSNNISVDIRQKVYNKKYITIDGYSGLSILNFTNISNGVFHAYTTLDPKLHNFGPTTSISEQLNWIDFDNRNFDKTVKDIFTYSSNNLFIGIDANKLSEFTIEALKQYLNENPIVIELTLS